jgi:parallel beta-helix repeat protein
MTWWPAPASSRRRSSTHVEPHKEATPRRSKVIIIRQPLGNPSPLRLGFASRRPGLSVLVGMLLIAGVVPPMIGPVGAASASHSANHFEIKRVGSTSTYIAQSQAKTYTGALKAVVESAVYNDLKPGGGTVTFLAGVFDLGAEYLRLEDISDIIFEGAGMNATIIKNSSDAPDDTEPFNTMGATRVTIRDLTVVAGGSPKTTSDAIDFDRGNFNLVERVKITASRGKGIIFDGKNFGWDSQGNIVRSCEIYGTNNDGIQFLASSNNRVEGCFIHDTVQDGIEATKSQNLPDQFQANKKSNDNVIIGNTIDNAGQNGIRIHSSDRNLITGNFITNSSNVTAGQDGIRILSTDSITCDDNRVEGNTATDNQATKTQAYGLNIASSLCNRTIVGTNNFASNKTGSIRDLGTNTQYVTSGTPPATPPVGPAPVGSAPAATAPSCRGITATLWGTGGADTLVGTPGNDVVVGQGGADIIRGLGGSDLLCGGAGADRIWGGLGADRMFGGTRGDVLRGGKGRDRLVGGKGKDTCAGGPGKDTAVGCELGSGP